MIHGTMSFKKEKNLNLLPFCETLATVDPVIRFKHPEDRMDLLCRVFTGDTVSLLVSLCNSRA